MVALKRISLFDLPKLIYISYKGDSDLLNEYHIAKMDLRSAVDSTFSMIMTASKIKDLKYYKVIYERQPIGYVATYDDNFLYSYGISVNFRKKDILIDWWKQIKKILVDDFNTMIYGNNTRAIEFLKKQGMKIIQEDKEHNVLTFINSK